MLGCLNGFYAFEGALHVFTSVENEVESDILAWNSANLWRDAYGDVAAGYVFFAEDVFGTQFAMRDGAVWTFDPETAEASFIADTLEGWAGALLDDFEVLSGYPAAHDWQVRHGIIPPGSRLMPKVPFVLGGEYAVENLYLLDSVTGMRVRGDVATQLKDVPDGRTVRLRVVD